MPLSPDQRRDFSRQDGWQLKNAILVEEHGLMAYVCLIGCGQVVPARRCKCPLQRASSKRASRTAAAVPAPGDPGGSSGPELLPLPDSRGMKAQPRGPVFASEGLCRSWRPQE